MTVLAYLVVITFVSAFVGMCVKNGGKIAAYFAIANMLFGFFLALAYLELLPEVRW